MGTDRDTRIEQIVHDALQCEDAEREALLRDACGDDAAMLAEVADRVRRIDSLGSTRTFLQRSQAEQEPRPLIDQSLGTYKILSRLGKGGMGEVFLALDTVLERKVALKLLPAEFTNDGNRIRRFVHEAKAASALNHPNIVSIYGLGDSAHGQYIVMEWVDGQNLRALRPMPLDIPTLRDIATQVARALQVTHAGALIHRDIKPDNIMVRRDGIVKVLDFGLARLVGPMPELGDATSATATGAIVGTVRYMSPEQARGEWLTAASDIFSLGIVLYELATDQHPFQADSAVGYLHAILARPVIPPSRVNSGIPAWLDNLLLQMLEKDPARRCTSERLLSALQTTDAQATLETPRTLPASRLTVGRKKERAELSVTFERVRNGRGAMLCISGEPGQGKTTLLEEFVADLVNRNRALAARGRCSERLAGAEAYLPILEILDTLANGLDREGVAAAMKSLAPGWYRQLAPSTVTAQPPSMPSADKLKWELAALLQEISRSQPLVIFLEDVQWADLSTVDLLSYLGTRLDGMRVLILATYRAPEMHSSNQPFLAMQLELQSRGVCREIALGFFSVGEIREYLDLKYPSHAFPDEFAAAIHQRTEGNPLFVTDLLRYLEERGAIVQQDERWKLTGPISGMLTGLPESVRSMVQRKMEHLGEDDRKMLTAASVQGVDFDAAVVARALDADPADVEEGLERLERKTGFVKLIAEYEYPDRSLTLRYRFVHVLYQNAFFATLRPTRRTALSKAVAEALIAFHRSQAGKIAAQVAYLFETARDFERAARYYQTASQNALRLFAMREAEAMARRGLHSVEALTDSPERAQLELGLQSALALALRDTGTHASGASIETHRRVKELSEQTGDLSSAFFAQVGFVWAALVNSEFSKAREHAEHCLEIGERTGDPGSVMQAYYLMGQLAFHQGEHAEAERHLREAIALYDPAKHGRMSEVFGIDVRVNGTALLAINRWYQGFPDQARGLLTDALRWARAIPHPVPLTMALAVQFFVAAEFQEPQTMYLASGEIIALAEKHGLQKNTMFWGTFGRGWARALLGEADAGLAGMREAMTEAAAIGMKYVIPTLGTAVGAVLAAQGSNEEALRVLARHIAEAEQTGPKETLSEKYRLKGEVLVRMGVEQGKEILSLALSTARRFEEKPRELRAAVSLARLFPSEETQSQLAGLYHWFTEGFDTPDLRAAKALLEHAASV